MALRGLYLSRPGPRNDFFFHRIRCRWSRAILLSAHHPPLEIRCCSYIILVRQIVILKGIPLSVGRSQIFVCAREPRTIRLRSSLSFLHVVYASFCHALSRLSAEGLTIDSWATIRLAQLRQVVFSESHVRTCRCLFGDFGNCFWLELDLLSLVHEELSNSEAKGYAGLSWRNHIDNLISDHA